MSTWLLAPSKEGDQVSIVTIMSCRQNSGLFVFRHSDTVCCILKQTWHQEPSSDSALGTPSRTSHLMQATFLLGTLPDRAMTLYQGR